LKCSVLDSLPVAVMFCYRLSNDSLISGLLQSNFGDFKQNDLWKSQRIKIINGNKTHGPDVALSHTNPRFLCPWAEMS